MGRSREGVHAVGNVVVIGGGFGGLHATRTLGRAGIPVTLIDRRNFHLFQPLLYQVATGSLSPGDIAAPLRAIFDRYSSVTVLLGEMVDLDPVGRRVLLSDGEVTYDTLVIAGGAAVHYFNHPEWEAHAPGLKTVEEATELRRRIFLAFEAAERESDPERRAAWLTFVVVGGGPTGVELAGALAEIARETLRGDFRAIDPSQARILVIERSARVLDVYNEQLSASAERALTELGVRIEHGGTVTAIDAESVTQQRGDVVERIPTHTVLWAAGVRASPLGKVLAERTGAPLDRGGRVQVGPDLTIPGHPEIFVIGDLASCTGVDGKPLPGLAPVAMQQGRYVGKVIRARQTATSGTPSAPFQYADKGSMATIGRGRAIADLGWTSFSGWFAWLTWLLIHIIYLVGFQNRFLVLAKWAMSYVTWNRGARLITGDSPFPLSKTS